MATAVATELPPLVTPEQYLATERAANFKSEYVNGRVYAMSGASDPHNLITLNTAAGLHARFRSRPCRVWQADMRVQVTATGLYTYPDVAALCGQPEFADAHVDTLLNPSVIVEVLSRSTEAYDRGEKFSHYRRLPSLREYVLVAQDRVRVEHRVRHDLGWLLTELDDLDATLDLPAVGCAIPLREIYDRVAPFAGEPPAR